jgi:FlaA1/EpsC-like NDP-sugar epimerase
MLADCIQTLPMIGTFIPGDIKSFYIKDILNELIKKYGNEDTQINITGIRPSEQLREYLNARDEVFKRHENGLCEIIKESTSEDWDCLTSDDCLGTYEDLIKTFNIQ